VNIRIVVGITLSAAIAIGLPGSIGTRVAWSASAPPTEACTAAMSNAAVEGASVGPQEAAGPGQEPPTVSLGGTIAVRISGLANLQKDCTAPIILYLNNYPIKSLKPFPPSSPPTLAAGGSLGANPPPSPSSSGELYFVLSVTDESRASWIPILGAPCCSARDIKVSVGIEDQYPLRPATGKTLPELKLDIIGNRWFAIWTIIFVVLVGVFFWCARHTNIIRDGNPATAAADASGTYSLSKSQGALWLFVILAAYLLIGMVTGDFSNSINSTALILLGIGAGTVVGSAVIDASKETQDAPKTKSDIVTTKASLTQIDQDMAAIDSQLKAIPSPPNMNDLKQQRDMKESERQQTLSEYRKLTRQSERFLTDILSDANGVSFHRFQMAAWTLVLGLVFIKGVYENLAMPEFNTTLMGLLGLSAGTYLGLKIPEATRPTK
jgi:hypothetical protein